jgi:hypothetical protein
VRSIVREGGEVPEWDAFALYRASARDYEMFELWCDRFFRVSKGNGKFLLLSKSKKISEILTLSDEGFVISVLNNGYERWVAEAKMLESEDASGSEDLPPMRWSEGGATSQKRHRGWKSDGIKFFNESCHEISSLRQMRHSKELEEKYLEKAKNEKNPKRLSKHRLDSTVVKPFCELVFEGYPSGGHDDNGVTGNESQQVGTVPGTEI